MKYNAPYGATDPNAPYVDQDTPGAVVGSVPPAASIEHPQREIVNLLVAVGLIPSAADLHQLSKAVQSGLLNYNAVGGTPNAITATLTQAPDSLFAGLSVTLNIITPNTGATTLNLNALGAKSVVNLFGGALVGGELTGPVKFTYDGTKWWAGVTQPAMSADRTYYVAPTGNDSNNGLTAGTAFLTLQRAMDVAASVDRRGFNLTISVADGTYAAFSTKQPTGSGTAKMTGNVGTPANVVVSSPGVSVSQSGWTVEGMAPRSSVVGGHSLSCNGATVTIGSMEWNLNNAGGSGGGAHIAAGAGGTVFVSGTQRITGGATIAHMYVADGGSIRGAGAPALNIVNSGVGFVNFVNAVNGSINVTYSSITNPSNVTAGNKFSASANGVINTNGAGINYYPGPTAGVQATGGQYV